MSSRPCQFSHNTSNTESSNPMGGKPNQSRGAPHCSRCVHSSPSENMEHNILVCCAYSDIRKRIIVKYTILCSMAKSGISLTDIVNDKNTFYQLILDTASCNSVFSYYPELALLSLFASFCHIPHKKLLWQPLLSLAASTFSRF